MDASILKLKQKLRSWGCDLDKLSEQQRRLAWGLGGLVLFLVVVFGIIFPLIDMKNKWAQELERKQLMLRHYQDLLAEQSKVAQTHQALKAALTQAEAKFLSGGNPAMAAADLQEILKTLTSDQDLKLTSINVLASREAGPYLEIPVQVQLSANIEQLLKFLYYLEHHQKLLYLTQLEINAARSHVQSQRPGVLRVSMEIAGVIKRESQV
ncbi:MAG: type II secretion system protein GspM [Desulfobacteraceae bacterium]